MEDKVNHPAHYTKHLVPQPGEVIDVIEAWDLPWHLGNVIKYIARHREKGGKEDLQKAAWYLNRHIEKMK